MVVFSEILKRDLFVCVNEHAKRIISSRSLGKDGNASADDFYGLSDQEICRNKDLLNLMDSMTELLINKRKETEQVPFKVFNAPDLEEESSCDGLCSINLGAAFVNVRYASRFILTYVHLFKDLKL